MHTIPLKLVVIVAEPVLEPQLIAELRALGARGFTIVEGRGEGTRQAHATEEGRNIRVETIVPPDVADRVMTHVAETYFAHYSVIAYTADVAVTRGEKYR